MIEGFEKPAQYAVYVTFTCEGTKKRLTARIGVANDAAKIPKIIADDKKAMGDTFGGLMAPVSIKGRTYRAFKADWSELTI